MEIKNEKDATINNSTSGVGSGKNRPAKIGNYKKGKMVKTSFYIKQEDLLRITNFCKNSNISVSDFFRKSINEKFEFEIVN